MVVYLGSAQETQTMYHRYSGRLRESKSERVARRMVSRRELSLIMTCEVDLLDCCEDLCF